MITNAMKPYETTNVYIASSPSERELMLEVRKHLESGGFRVRTMHESEIAFRAAYPDCDYLREMFEGKSHSSEIVYMSNSFSEMAL